MDDDFKTADFDQNMPVVLLLAYAYGTIIFFAERSVKFYTHIQKTGSLFTARNNGK
jgi:hypothetical protein